jgi:hypothetical protein
MAAPGADDEEYVQLTVPEVFVYKVPPRTSAQGHKCVRRCVEVVAARGWERGGAGHLCGATRVSTEMPVFDDRLR